MKKMFYYQPIIRAVAENGSERLGVILITRIWEEGRENRKMEMSIQGKDRADVLEKFKNCLKSDNHPEPIELPCNYFLCSEVVESKYKPFEVSKPFQSGYDHDKRSHYYIAWLQLDEVDKYYKEVVEPHNKKSDNQIDYWCRECSPGTMDVSEINMKDAKKNGLFKEIESATGLTMETNIAMTIFELSELHGCTPVQLINKYL
ncbi:hypothetical protein [Flavobacterium sp. 25HG05S-40]|uniref:hypothetical protein n=1 Tax=Flavobacterium sp. 25HG05S-40 TaxID=3458682 RepID=UPI004044BB2A